MIKISVPEFPEFYDESSYIDFINFEHDTPEARNLAAERIASHFINAGVHFKENDEVPILVEMSASIRCGSSKEEIFLEYVDCINLSVCLEGAIRAKSDENEEIHHKKHLIDIYDKISLIRHEIINSSDELKRNIKMILKSNKALYIA